MTVSNPGEQLTQQWCRTWTLVTSAPLAIKPSGQEGSTYISCVQNFTANLTNQGTVFNLYSPKTRPGHKFLEVRNRWPPQWPSGRCLGTSTPRPTDHSATLLQVKTLYHLLISIGHEWVRKSFVNAKGHVREEFSEICSS